MPVLHVTLLEGRPAETKERLISELTEAAVSVLRVEPEAVRVLLNELPPAHWGVGGKPKSQREQRL